jgi:integrase/recombinase XerD
MESPNLPAFIPPRSATLQRKRAGALVPASPDHLPVYVTAEEARAIINAAEGFKARLLLESIWQTGGRISEVLRIRPGDIDVESGTVQLVNLKQRRRSRKVVYISIDLAGQLRALAKDLRISADGYLFQSRESHGEPMSRFQAYPIISTAAREARVFKISPKTERLVPAWPHTFRHGAAMHQLEATRRLDYVQDQLGHSSLETTKVYLRLADADKRRLRDQVSY